MREATAIALVLAILLGVLSVSQFSSLATSIQGSLAAGPLDDFVGLWPIFVVLLALGAAGAFILGVARRR